MRARKRERKKERKIKVIGTGMKGMEGVRRAADRRIQTRREVNAVSLETVCLIDRY
jgi:hypothetical protein